MLLEAGKTKEGIDAYEAAIDRIKSSKMEDKPKEEFTNVCRETVGQWMLEAARQKKYDNALEAANELAKNDWFFAQLKGDVLRESGKIDESIPAFEDTIEQARQVGRARRRSCATSRSSAAATS